MILENLTLTLKLYSQILPYRGFRILINVYY
ncbi:unnamed protein product, partial [Rotaria sp. Silwood1]